MQHSAIRDYFDSNQLNNWASCHICNLALGARCPFRKPFLSTSFCTPCSTSWREAILYESLLLAWTCKVTFYRICWCNLWYMWIVNCARVCLELQTHLRPSARNAMGWPMVCQDWGRNSNSEGSTDVESEEVVFHEAMVHSRRIRPRFATPSTINVLMRRPTLNLAILTGYRSYFYHVDWKWSEASVKKKKKKHLILIYLCITQDPTI